MDFMRGINTDNIMLLNIIYHRATEDRDWKDELSIIYKDLKTGDKHIKKIPAPDMEIYFAKEKFRDYDYNKNFFAIKDSDIYRLPYRRLVKEIAKLAGPKYVSFVDDCYRTGRWGEVKSMHQYPYVFGSDYDIENWYRIWFFLNYHHEKPKPITKLFLDIEYDGIGVEGFKKDGECPINAITVMDDCMNTSYTFLLRNKKNPLIEKFENDIEGFKENLHAEFDETYGKIEYKFFMYDNEIELISDTFKLVNTLKRDFLLIWNLSFDIPYIIGRLRRLGVDAADIICHKDFERRDLFFKKDIKNFQVEKKGDYFRVSSYTVYLDQMLVYAQLRKGGGELRSYALTSIAQKELKDGKLDYSEVANIKTLPYVDYGLFVRYNIKDVLLQRRIELKTQDLENVYQRSYYNATTYEKIFRQSIFLANRAYMEYYNQGYIIGNNANIDYSIQWDDLPEVEEENDDDDDEGTEKKQRFEGALVGGPHLNNHTGIRLLGTRSMYIFDNCVDFDFTGLYPSINITFNIAPNTLLGKLFINKRVDAPDIDEGKLFTDNLLIDNPLLMGTTWFNLPAFQDLYGEFKDTFKIRKKDTLVIEKDSCMRRTYAGSKIIYKL
jgi:hypothetical protein